MCARGEPVALGSIRYRMLTLWRLPKWRRAAAAMGWLLAAAFATLAAVQYAELRTMCVAAMGTFPDWLAALGGIATLLAVIVAWVAYRSEANARLAAERRNDKGQWAVTVKIVEDSRPEKLSIPEPIIYMGPAPPHQMLAAMSRGYEDEDEPSGDGTNWVREVEQLQERWGAHKHRFFAYFIAHPSADVIDTAVELHDELTTYLRRLEDAAPLMGDMVNVLLSPTLGRDEVLQRHLNDLMLQSRAVEIGERSAKVMQLVSLLGTLIDIWEPGQPSILSPPS